MNAHDWQTTNSQYLSAALTWLRLRMLQLAKLSPSETSPEQIKRAAETMAKLESTDQPPALVLLSAQLGLSRFESEILLLCAAMEFDTRVPVLCARIQDDPARPYPSFALALTLFDDPAWEALSPDRPLRYWRLLEINQPVAQPLTKSSLRADERIVSYLKGLNTLDDRLTAFVSPMESGLPSFDQLPPSQEAFVVEILDHWQHVPQGNRLSVIQLLGPDPISKQLVAERVAETLGRQMFRLTLETLPTQFGELETLARLWQRESLLLPIALYLDTDNAEIEMPEHTAALQHFLHRTDGVIFVERRTSGLRLPRAHFSIEIAKPTPAEQQEMWGEVLGQGADASARQLAAQFNLNVTTIAQIAQDVLTDSSVAGDQLTEKIWARCCAATRPRLEALAQRIEPKATWDDLVLPAEQTALLYQIAYRVAQRQTVYEEWGFAKRMNRGLGLSVLFAGDSGTGKTMAAEVIANELRLNLYRIDLSAVVSKYIGETEKNLCKVFDGMEDGCGIMFFDEADSFFGKRSEVKDSHDRYANIEINYLLQRMESYRGLAILATNMKSQLDPAFTRRLSCIVNFPCPDVQERKLIWQKVFPAEVPKDDLDYERLGRFNITGGSIQSIALNAAFAAAQEKSNVNMSTVLTAARGLFRQIGKPITNELDFRV